jgi:hypothetical protein
VQPKALRVEVDEAFGERRAAQAAVEPVRPRMVRALDAADAAGGVVDQPRAAVAAGVQERAREPVVVADDEHVLTARVDCEIAPTSSDLLDMTGTDPPAAEEVGTFPIEHHGVGEGPARQHRGPLQRQARTLGIRGVERQSGVRDGHRGSPPGSSEPTLPPSLCNWPQSQFGQSGASLDARLRLRIVSSAHPT